MTYQVRINEELQTIEDWDGVDVSNSRINEWLQELVDAEKKHYEAHIKAGHDPSTYDYHDCIQSGNKIATIYGYRTDSEVVRTIRVCTVLAEEEFSEELPQSTTPTGYYKNKDGFLTNPDNWKKRLI